MMKLRFTRTNGEVDEMIDHLMETAGPVSSPDLIREMIIAALKSGQDRTERSDLKLMNTTLKEMRITTRVFGPYRQVRKVTVFGSARTRPEEPVYRMAVEFGRRLAEEGLMVITGAGGGIMEAANIGAGPGMSFGVNIRLPFEQKANDTLEGNPRLINYKYFFNRKVAFLREADAVALFPGGFGTLDEAMETLTLMQTGKATPMPLVLIDEPGGTYWKKWIQFLHDDLLAQGYLSECDFELFERVDSVETAVSRIRAYYRRYHSIRYIDGLPVVRMQTPLPEEVIADLRSRFGDMLTPGGSIRAVGLNPLEADEPELADLPRLALDFNQRDFGRLRSFIGALNEY
ncbi:MAG: hypothetical protein FD164_1162 [Nitrospirae bacterium]|nr:MAG: hypothetical protein FD164_1162 [Nitrospirota bacterium]